MAVSALSLSHSGTGQTVDALQYYQQAFPSLQISLRNENDLVSDGLFLTHFLLLIYEVRLVLCLFLLSFHFANRVNRSLLLNLMAPIYGPTTSPVYFTSLSSVATNTAGNLTLLYFGGSVISIYTLY